MKSFLFLSFLCPFLPPSLPPLISSPHPQMCKCMSVGIFMKVRGQPWLLFLSHHPSCFMRQVLLLAWSLPCMARIGGQEVSRQGSTCFCLVLAFQALYPVFYKISGGSNASPHACKESTLATYLSPRPNTMLLSCGCSSAQALGYQNLWEWDPQLLPKDKCTAVFVTFL
jgi:hypothetical protein